MQNQDIVNKGIKTNMKKYGVSSFSKSKLFLDKYTNTCLKNFGYSYPMQNPEILERSMRTQYLNGNMKCSSQQKYIHNLLGGKLNYPVNRFSLDIAFPEDKIYIEYDGGGHNLSVKLGNKSLLEFNNREIMRYYILKREGWKMIKIISPKDYLPSDKILLEEYNKALEWFKSDDKYHSHYNVDLGIKANSDDYGHLRQIKRDLLESI